MIITKRNTLTYNWITKESNIPIWGYMLLAAAVSFVWFLVWVIVIVMPYLAISPSYTTTSNVPFDAFTTPALIVPMVLMFLYIAIAPRLKINKMSNSSYNAYRMFVSLPKHVQSGMPFMMEAIMAGKVSKDPYSYTRYGSESHNRYHKLEIIYQNNKQTNPDKKAIAARVRQETLDAKMKDLDENLANELEASRAGAAAIENL